jgi:hypothetical protein
MLTLWVLGEREVEALVESPLVNGTTHVQTVKPDGKHIPSTMAVESSSETYQPKSLERASKVDIIVYLNIWVSNRANAIDQTSRSSVKFSLTLARRLDPGLLMSPGGSNGDGSSLYLGSEKSRPSIYSS